MQQQRSGSAIDHGLALMASAYAAPGTQGQIMHSMDNQQPDASSMMNNLVQLQQMQNLQNCAAGDGGGAEAAATQAAAAWIPEFLAAVCRPTTKLSSSSSRRPVGPADPAAGRGAEAERPARGAAKGASCNCNSWMTWIDLAARSKTPASRSKPHSSPVSGRGDEASAGWGGGTWRLLTACGRQHGLSPARAGRRCNN